MVNDFLSFVRLGVGNESVQDSKFKVQGFETVDWDAIEAFAEKQGLFGVVYDGALSTALLPLTVKLRWMGKVMQGYEQRYALYRKAVADLGAWYHAQGFRMMLLKGLACGMDWPRPEHRPYGDIDIWLFGKQKEADKAIEKELEIRVDNSQHHHSVFNWQGFMVENHYDFINVHHHRSNVELEKIFKALGLNDSNSFDLDGVKVFLPSANLQALFLLKHLANHFSTERVIIRQILDWAFFARKHGSKIEWSWLEETLEQFGLMPFYKIINAICVDDLGFDVKIFPEVQFDPILKDRVLKEILGPGFSDKEPEHVWKRIPFKYKRWKSNGWKHELCYKESMESAFWSGVKNHLLKPASI